MDSPIKKAIILVLITVVRYFIVYLCGTMIEHRFMTQTEAELLQNPVLYLTVATALIAAFWGGYARLKSYFTTLVALRLAKNTPHETVKEIVADSSIKDIVTLTPDPKKLS